MADLVLLEDVKTSMAIQPSDNRKDAMIEQLIPAASLAVQNYAERDFGSASVTETRSFEYDGSGYLDIDDASDLTAVSFSVPHAANFDLTVDDWYGAPSRRDDSPVFYYIVIRGGSGLYPISPAMGFTRNLDVLAAEGRYPTVSTTALVTGTWGWPVVPEDVKLATLWTIQDWLTKPPSEGVTAEAIESYSRSYGSRTGNTMPALAIPNKARDILAQYQKQNV